MRQTIIAAAAAFVIGGISTGAMLSHAQPLVPAQQESDRGMPAGHPEKGGWGHRMDGNGHHMGRFGGPRHGGMQAFGLIHRQPDRQLAPADVQKIAEAFLLWNGNHTWKVTDVAPSADGPIAFSLTTPEGSTVAKFTMDPHSGKIARVG